MNGHPSFLFAFLIMSNTDHLFTATIKSLQITHAGESKEEREPAYTIGGNIIDTTTMENNVEFLKRLK